MIHIITAAPSTIGRDYGIGDDEVSICVNRAVMNHDCDLWVAGDTFTVEWCMERTPKRFKELWTMKNEKPTPKGFRVLGRFDLLPGWCELAGGHANWSIQGAIALAVHLRQYWNVDQRIIIHGTEAYFDPVPVAKDAAGYDGPQADRGAERWKREREDLDLSIKWAQGKGATVYLDRT